MPDDEDWEFVPHKILADLRDEVQVLKDRMGKPDAPASELLASMNDLRNSVIQMHSLFKEALGQVKAEGEEIPVGRALQALAERLSNIEKQNEQLAKAMVAVAEMVEEMNKKIELRAPPAFRPSGPRPPPPRPAIHPPIAAAATAPENFPHPPASQLQFSFPEEESLSLPPPPPLYSAPGQMMSGMPGAAPAGKGLFGKIFKR